MVASGLSKLGFAWAMVMRLREGWLERERERVVLSWREGGIVLAVVEWVGGGVQLHWCQVCVCKSMNVISRSRNERSCGVAL